MAQPSFQDVLIAGIARSGKARNQQIATNETEMVQMMKRSQRTAFALAARINPFYFATQNAVSKITGNWAWPVDMELLFRLETDAGAECVIVPVDQKSAEPSLPAVYPLGKKLYPAGQATDPTAALTFMYSRRPVDPTVLTSLIDADFPESHLDLLIGDVAVYLAIKDGRGDDAQAFTSERNSHLALFLAHLEHATASLERRKYANIRRFNLQTLLPYGAANNGGVTG